MIPMDMVVALLFWFEIAKVAVIPNLQVFFI